MSDGFRSSPTATPKRRGLRRSVLVLGLTLCAATLAGCSTKIDAGQGETAVLPSTTPARTATSFTDALSCMDDLLMRHQFGQAVPISSIGVIDSTNKVAVGGRDMVIHAVSLMTRRSEAFHYIDLDPRNMQEMGDNQRRPVALLIRGTISELNNSVLSKDMSIGVGTHSVLAGMADQQMANVLTVDMSMENAAQHEIIPSTSVSNELVLIRRDKGTNLNGHIGSPGLNFSYSTDSAEGEARGARTLVELSMIEMVGKYYKLPYWQCLGVTDTDPRATKLANEHYLDLKPEQRVAFAAGSLRQAGFYHGGEATVWTAELRTAAAQYQQTHGLVATGLENFELFAALLKDPAAGASYAALAPDPADRPAPPALLPASAGPLVHVSADGVEQPGTTKFYAGLPVFFEADVSAAGYLVCFYQDADKSVFRVYPTANQAEIPLVAGGHVALPGTGDGFRIVPTDPGSQERFACFASPDPIVPALPQPLAGAPLTVLPVTDIDAVDQILTRELGPKLSRDMLVYNVGAAAP